MLKLYVLNLPLLRKSGVFFLLTVPQALLKNFFFDKISVSVNKILSKCDNITLAGDLNIDELRPCSISSKNHLPNMKDIFGLTNPIKEQTCFKSQNSTLLDLILTNTPRSFMQSQNFETGLSDYKLIIQTCLYYSKSLFQEASP